MKQNQHHYLIASFAALFFVILGYMVAFYPDLLTGFDNPIQHLVRGNLPSLATQFFKAITAIGNTSTQVIIAVIAIVFLLVKNWKAEALFVTTSSLIAAICILSLKYLYGRPRPSLSHLVEASGYSFPSGHSMGTMLIIGSLVIIIGQRIANKKVALGLQVVLGALIFLVGLSRIYLGVHYPSDVLAGFTFGFGALHLIYPYYEQKRFEWRFQSKQK